MVYFANKDLNRIYTHSLLFGFAENAGGVFIFVYLLKAGLGVPLVLASIGALLTTRLAFRQGVLPFAKRFGVRSALVMGAALGAVSYVALAFVDGADGKLLLFMLLAAFGEAFYWSSFHATVASLGDSHARGAQTSAIQLVYALTSVIGPIAGGFALAFIGPKAAFLAAAVAQGLSVIPLSHLPYMPVPQAAKLQPAANRIAAMAYFGDGIMAAGHAFTWSMALFITLGERFQAYGLAQALAALVGAAMALGLGRLIDAGHPKRSAAIGFSAIALVVVLKALFYATPALALVALAASAVAAPIYSSAYNSRIYNLAQASGDALRFHVSGEGGWDLGATIGCLSSAALIHFGFSFLPAIGLGLVGISIVSLVIRESYQKSEPSLRV